MFGSRSSTSCNYKQIFIKVKLNVLVRKCTKEPFFFLLLYGIFSGVCIVEGKEQHVASFLVIVMKDSTPPSEYEVMINTAPIQSDSHSPEP